MGEGPGRDAVTTENAPRSEGEEVEDDFKSRRYPFNQAPDLKRWKTMVRYYLPKIRHFTGRDHVQHGGGSLAQPSLIYHAVPGNSMASLQDRRDRRKQA